MASETVSIIPQRCEHCAIRDRTICGALSEEELFSISRIARLRTVPAGQVIAAESDQGTALANILSGVVKLTKTLTDGRQQIVGLQFPPDFLGRTFSDVNPHAAEAATDVELCAFPKKDFEAVVKRHPGLEHRLLEDALDELDAARDWMLLLGRKTAREKVATFLLMLARRAPNIGCAHTVTANHVAFHLPLTRADMADYLGLTLETVSRQMTKLKTTGVIELTDNREIVIPDIEALSEQAGV